MQISGVVLQITQPSYYFGIQTQFPLLSFVNPPLHTEQNLGLLSQD